MLEFLSHYQVDFTLSIDGNEALTNYLRPVVNSPYKVGYMKALKKIIPTFLYYFPTTPFRLIINARYVDLLYQVYQFANELGFPYFTFLIDFGHRDFDKPNEKPKNNYLKWEEKHTEILEEQLMLIVNNILSSYKQGIKRTQVLEFNQILQYLFNETKFTPENIHCQLFNKRSLTTLYNNDLEGYCLKREFPDIEELKIAVMDEYNSLNHICYLDEKCPMFDYCCIHCCIQSGYYKSKRFFDFDTIECLVIKSCYKAILKLLSVGNDECKDTFLYQQYILDMMEQGGA